jgi:hypothetical protein
MLTARRRRNWLFEISLILLGLLCVSGSLLHLFRLRLSPPAPKTCPLGPEKELLLKACLFGHINDPKWLKAALCFSELAFVGLGLAYILIRKDASTFSKRQGIFFFSGIGLMTIGHYLVRLSYGMAIFVVFCLLVFLSIVLTFLSVFMIDPSEPRLYALRSLLTTSLWSIQLSLLVSIFSNSTSAGIAMLSAGTAVAIISFLALRLLSHPLGSMGRYEDEEVLIKKSLIIDSIA